MPLVEPGFWNAAGTGPAKPLKNGPFVGPVPKSSCGGEMVLRKRKGDGKSFYGCKSYPKCRGIVNVE